MEINFNNPDFDNYLEKAGFIRQDDNDSNSTVFKNGGVTIDLSKGLTASTLGKIVNCAFDKGSIDKASRIKELLG